MDLTIEVCPLQRSTRSSCAIVFSHFIALDQLFIWAHCYIIACSYFLRDNSKGMSTIEIITTITEIEDGNHLNNYCHGKDARNFIKITLCLDWIGSPSRKRLRDAGKNEIERAVDEQGVGSHLQRESLDDTVSDIMQSSALSTLLREYDESKFIKGLQIHRRVARIKGFTRDCC